jgi:hypothetical protein
MTDNVFRLAEAQHAEPEWWRKLSKSATGKPIPNLANALVVLRSDPAFSGIFAHDLMRCGPLLLRALGDEGAFRPRLVTDVDVGLLQELLQGVAVQLSRDTVHQAVDIVAHQNRFHPVRHRRRQSSGRVGRA